MLLSPYFLCSGVIWGLLKPIWYDGKAEDYPWVEIALGVIPTLLGFSISAFAVFLAIASKDFLSALESGPINLLERRLLA
jgi:hypothetical protein